MARKKIELEYILNTRSQSLVWDAISTPAGLEGWFADRIEVSNKTVTFYWGENDEESRVAEVAALRTFFYIRFKWLDNPHDREYFEFRMTQNELTNDFILEIKDFGESDELDELEELWDSDVEALRRIKGF